PERREQPQLRVGGIAAEEMDDPVVFVPAEAVGHGQLRRHLRRGPGHGVSPPPLPVGQRRSADPFSTRLPRSERKSSRPSVLPPTLASAARSGCGMSPTTVPSSFATPATFPSKPSGLAD